MVTDAQVHAACRAFFGPTWDSSGSTTSIRFTMMRNAVEAAFASRPTPVIVGPRPVEPTLPTFLSARFRGPGRYGAGSGFA